MVGDDPHPPYERPALSKGLLRGQTAKSEIGLRSADQLHSLDIDLRTGVRVLEADADARSVALSDGSTLDFDRLVLATGARALRPPFASAPGTGVMTLRTVADAQLLRDAARGRHVLVVGSGFIGCETAASLGPQAAKVTLAADEELPLQARAGAEAGRIVQGWLADAGVEFRQGLSLEGIRQEQTMTALFDSASIEADLVLLALGIERNTELASQLGLSADRRGVPVAASTATALPGVFAAGDAAFAFNASAGRHLAVEHWGDALSQGQVAGARLAGDDDAVWSQAPGFWTTIGERTLKYVGWGDGFDRVSLTRHDGRGFTARQYAGDALVGALCHEADGDYEDARSVLEGQRP